MCFFSCVIFFIWCRSYLKRRTGEERILADFRDEVNEILAEIDEKTDRDSLLVEERIARLKKILDDTDKRIALYVRELENRGKQEQTYAELGKNRLRIINPPEPEPRSEASALPVALPVPKPQRPRKSRPKKQPVPQQAAEMARGGLSPGLIASHLGISISEAELAAAMSGAKAPKAGSGPQN